MRTICLLFLFFCYTCCAAQKNASEVSNAEKNFAAYSVQHGTKAAFLQFADSSGLVFEGGNAVNAIETWKKREARAGVLNWHPVYDFVAASGELGFTSGPWTFQPRTITDSIGARGQYSTIWHKNASGEWKFLLDMGISNTPAFDSTTFYFNNKKIAFDPGTPDDLLSAEQEFIENTKEKTHRLKSYLAVLSSETFLLNRNHSLPSTTRKDTELMLRTMPDSIRYNIKGSGISRSGDLGYVYGTAIIHNKVDSYLRIWRREGESWKLALEVLPY